MQVNAKFKFAPVDTEMDFPGMTQEDSSLFARVSNLGTSADLVHIALIVNDETMTLTSARLRRALSRLLHRPKQNRAYDLYFALRQPWETHKKSLLSGHVSYCRPAKGNEYGNQYYVELVGTQADPLTGMKSLVVAHDLVQICGTAVVAMFGLTYPVDFTFDLVGVSVRRRKAEGWSAHRFFKLI